MTQRILVILIALDCLIYTLLVLGDCNRNETMSGAAWRTEQEGRILGTFFRPKIDWLFNKLGDPDHCRVSYENESRN